MANYPAVAQSGGTYANIESLQQIRPPYPAILSAEWWELRKRVEAIMARSQRKAGVKWSKEDLARSKAATLASLGDEQGIIEYERNGFTREQWLLKWFPEAAGGVAVAPLDRIRTLRNVVRDL